MFPVIRDRDIQNIVMSLDNMEYSLMLSSLAKKAGEVSIPVTRLASLLAATSLCTVGQLVLAQMTHSITLLTLVHQNIYNSLTLLVSVLTQWKSREEVGKHIIDDHSKELTLNV